jgi:hypothetical protein
MSLQHMKLTTTTPCLGEVTGTVKHTTHYSVEWDSFECRQLLHFSFFRARLSWSYSIVLSARRPQCIWKAQLSSIVISQLSQALYECSEGLPIHVPLQGLNTSCNKTYAIYIDFRSRAVCGHLATWSYLPTQLFTDSRVNVQFHVRRWQCAQLVCVQRDMSVIGTMAILTQLAWWRYSNMLRYIMYLQKRTHACTHVFTQQHYRYHHH